MPTVTTRRTLVLLALGVVTSTALALALRAADEVQAALPDVACAAIGAAGLVLAGALLLVGIASALRSGRPCSSPAKLALRLTLATLVAALTVGGACARARTSGLERLARIEEEARAERARTNPRAELTSLTEEVQERPENAALLYREVVAALSSSGVTAEEARSFVPVLLRAAAAKTCDFSSVELPTTPAVDALASALVADAHERLQGVEPFVAAPTLVAALRVARDLESLTTSDEARDAALEELAEIVRAGFHRARGGSAKPEQLDAVAADLEAIERELPDAAARRATAVRRQILHLAPLGRTARTPVAFVEELGLWPDGSAIFWRWLPTAHWVATGLEDLRASNGSTAGIWLRLEGICRGAERDLRPLVRLRLLRAALAVERTSHGLGFFGGEEVALPEDPLIPGKPIRLLRGTGSDAFSVEAGPEEDYKELSLARGNAIHSTVEVGNDWLARNQARDGLVGPERSVRGTALTVLALLGGAPKDPTRTLRTRDGFDHEVRSMVDTVRAAVRALPSGRAGPDALEDAALVVLATRAAVVVDSSLAPVASDCATRLAFLVREQRGPGRDPARDYVAASWCALALPADEAVRAWATSLEQNATDARALIPASILEASDARSERIVAFLGSSPTVDAEDFALSLIALQGFKRSRVKAFAETLSERQAHPRHGDRDGSFECATHGTTIETALALIAFEHYYRFASVVGAR